MGSVIRETPDKPHNDDKIERSVSAVQVVVTHVFIEKPDLIYKLTHGRLGRTNIEVETVRRNLNEVLAIFRLEQATYRKSLKSLLPAMEKIHTALGAIITDYNAHIDQSVKNHNRRFGTRITCREGKINLGNLIDIYGYFNLLEKEFHAMELLRETIEGLLNGIDPGPMAIRQLRAVPMHAEELEKALSHLSHIRPGDMPTPELQAKVAALCDIELTVRRDLLPCLSQNAKPYLHLLAYADHASYLRREMIKKHETVN